MLVESIAIFLVLFVMLLLFIRSHKRMYAVFTIPLLVTPFLHAAVSILGEVAGFAFSADVRAAADVLGLAISVAMMGMFCTNCKTRRTKYAYLCLCGGFATLLTIIFIYDIYVSV